MGKPPRRRTRHSGLLSLSLPSLVRLEWVPSKSSGSKQAHRMIIIIIIITTTMFMVLSSRRSHCESSPGSFDECRMAPSGRRPKTKPDDLGCESACTGCQKLHPPSPFIIITQPESLYSFYRPTEGARLSRPGGWLHTEMVYLSTDGHPSWY